MISLILYPQSIPLLPPLHPPNNPSNPTFTTFPPSLLLLLLLLLFPILLHLPRTHTLPYTLEAIHLFLIILVPEHAQSTRMAGGGDAVRGDDHAAVVPVVKTGV
jgi:hypothetical protein